MQLATGAVQSILATAQAPLGAGGIAPSLKGKRAANVNPVFDALAGLGMPAERRALRRMVDETLRGIDPTD